MPTPPRAVDRCHERTLLDGPSPPRPSAAARNPTREIRFLDFKDGQTSVAVANGPVDPSRICITLRSDHAVLQVSVEESVGRAILEGLAGVLPTFRAVRSRIRRT